MVNIVKLFIVCFFSLIGNSPVCTNGIEPKSLMVYRGNTPVIDGIISEGEYDDAMLFEGFADWSHEINPVKLKTDLSLKAWVKHDGKDLYFASGFLMMSSMALTFQDGFRRMILPSMISAGIAGPGSGMGLNFSYLRRMIVIKDQGTGFREMVLAGKWYVVRTSLT